MCWLGDTWWFTICFMVTCLKGVGFGFYGFERCFKSGAWSGLEVSLRFRSFYQVEALI